ncbi:MAG: prepilin-type N-terminal cleavage/methylation domain-containing protein [Planctomycetota bacterium]|jgi:prepilin-type N-terminal cleavage/methylation domain-containing protein
MKSTRRLWLGFDCRGFTLVELLVALVVTGIVFAAVATLAYAASAADDATDDTSQKQAQVRYARLRISDLIRHCKLICYAAGDDFALWRADDNDDGQININELVYVESGTSRDHLQICEFPSSDNSAINLSAIGALATNWWSAYSSEVSSVRLIPQCSNVQFSFDVLPPQSGFVSISFDLVENNVVRRYQMSAALRGWAGHLLDGSGEIVASDDD